LVNAAGVTHILNPGEGGELASEPRLPTEIHAAAVQ
jgi:hypothetical protein